MNTTHPACLISAQEHYTDTAARELIAAAWELAAQTPTPPDERSQMLIKLLLDLRGDASLLAAGLLVAPWRYTSTLKHSRQAPARPSPRCYKRWTTSPSSTTCTNKNKATSNACAKCSLQWQATCAPSS